MSTVATIIAIVLGPILAVQIQKVIERAKRRHEEQRALFMTLMATRGRPLNEQHVQSLNMIDVTFRTGRRKENAVVEAWSELRDHLYNYPQLPPAEAGKDTPGPEKSAYAARGDAWQSQKDELLIELLAKMAEALGYHFDKVLLRRGAYTPQAYGTQEFSQNVILSGFASLFLGTRSLPVDIVNLPAGTESKAIQEVPDNTQKEDGEQEHPE